MTAVDPEKKERREQRRAAAIDIFAVLLILSGVAWFLGFGKFSAYQQLFSPLPLEAIRLRYLLSLTGRILGIACGLGLLCYKEFFRKLGLLLCLVTVCIIPWKHPYYVFQKLDQKVRWYAEVSLPGEDEGFYKDIAALGINLCFWAVNVADLGFAGLFIYFFTRPNFKKEFN